MFDFEEAQRREDLYNKAAKRQTEIVDILQNDQNMPEKERQKLIDECNSYYPITGASYD